MPAETMVTLARTMEGDDNIGIIQCVLCDINSHTLFGRLMSFIGNMTLSISYAAEYYFRLGREYYYGHGAILRSEAIVKHCSLPIFSGTKIFAEGKPMSHDIFEAALLEGAGWETWRLPSLISFDQQVHNLRDWIVRETRWLNGNVNWLRMWRYKNLSSYGKTNLLFFTLNYTQPLFGIVSLCLSLYGLYFTLMYPLKILYIFQHYRNMILLSGVLIVFNLFFPSLSIIFYHYKVGTYKKVGGVFKLTFSCFLRFFIELFIAMIKMFFLSRAFLNWLRGIKSVWPSQDRKDRGALSWEESFKISWYISLVGLIFTYCFYYYIYPLTIMEERTHLLSISPALIFFIFGIPLMAMVFAPVTVRLTSRSFPLMEKTGWFKHQFEGENEPLVVRETYAMTACFEKQIPEEWGFEQALSDPYFALRHLAQCPSRPQKYAFWKDKLAGRNIQDLTRLEKLVVFRCRELWEMFMTKNLNVAQEKPH